MSVQQISQIVRLRKRVGINADLCSSGLNIPALNARALASLRLLFDEEEQAFSDGADFVRGRLCRRVVSRPRSIIALLGLHFLAGRGASVPFDLRALREEAVADTTWVGSLGDLGLLMWFSAECFPESLGPLFTRFDFEHALERYPDGAEGQTRALSWFLTGLARAHVVANDEVPDLTDLAVDAYQRLERNRSESGLFGHLSTPKSIVGMIRARCGTFEDQIHAIYALAKFASAFGVEEPLEAALNCANAVCAIQGDKGEWWPVYHKHTGTVVSRYPVRSANQYGIAPLGLMAVQEATGQNFHEAILKGLRCDVGAAVAIAQSAPENLDDYAIALQSIEVGSSMGAWCEAIRRLLNAASLPVTQIARIRREIRADHCGWTLCAFGEYGLPQVLACHIR